METRLGGLHHVTAVTGHAAENLTFYTQVLGMRLVKKTVNQDDVSAYHLFYGDEWASWHRGDLLRLARRRPQPPWHGRPSRRSLLRVPDRAALDWWARRFDERGVAHERHRRSAADAPRCPSPIRRGSGWSWWPGDGEAHVAGGRHGRAAPSRPSIRYAGCMRVRLVVGAA